MIEKDLASSLLATEIDADLLLIATDVNGVFADYNTPSQRLISRMQIVDTRGLFLGHDRTLSHQEGKSTFFANTLPTFNHH